MRNSKLIFILLTLCSPAPLMQAEIGCLDNSRRLMVVADPKDYHLVKCNCPCSRYQLRADRGQCPECLHFRDPRPFIIIEPSKDPHSVSNQVKTIKTKKTINWGIREG